MELRMDEARKLYIFTSKVLIAIFSIPICLFFVALL